MLRNKLIANIAILILVATGVAFGGGGAEIPAPSITLDLPETSYISPENSEGIQDQIDWQVTITAAQNMVIKGYRIVITDSADREIYLYEEAYPGAQPFYEQFLINIGFANLKKPLTVPETLSWDGTETNGTAAGEGTYSLRVEGWDDKGRTGATAQYTVIIDNTAPTAVLSFPHTIFSPNADGNKDILIIEQTGSEETLWTGSFIDEEGNAIYEVTWKNQAPANLIWDGMVSADTIAPDGTYTYVLAATDLAGNSFETEAQTVTINTQDTPLSVTKNVGYFSPNDDGSIDTIEFAFEVPVTDGIRSWKFEILTLADGDGEKVKRTDEGEMIPSGFVFDGTGGDGTVLPEGVYRGRLSVLYENGNNPSADSAEFTIDLTPPSVSVKAFPQVFSPNGDGIKDTVQVYQETSLEETWNGQVYDINGEIVREIQWRGRADATVTWNGRDGENVLVEDGQYQYRLSSRDRAGNYSEDTTAPIILDTRETPVTLRADGTYFSPNADGVRDELTLLPDITDPVGIQSLVARITDQAGNPVREFNFTEAKSAIVWDGKDETSQPAPNGPYYADLEVVYEHGNKPSARFGPIVIDRSVPTAEVGAGVTIFSPDGDGKQDDVQITQINTSEEDEWIGTFVNETGGEVRTLQWSGKADSFTWDGTDQEGNALPDGHYRYVLTSTDRAGNTGTFSIDRITIDTRETPVSLRIGSSSFSPNGDQVKDTLVIKPVLQVTDNIDNWNLKILDSANQVVRTFSGVSNIPAAIEFDGNADNGNALPEQSYTASLAVLYRNGNNPSTTSPAFTIDKTQPIATVSVEPALFSPNGDGKKDTTTFVQNGSTEETWRGWIVNGDNDTVRTFRWYGELEPRLEWDGTDDNGRTVANGSYYYSISAIDRAGNQWESEPVRVRIDARTTTVSLAIEPEFISPNGDNVQDALRITPTININDQITRHVVEILDGNGRVVRAFEGTGRLPQRITWNGQTAAGTNAPDGDYSARIRVEYDKGDAPTAESTVFHIDTVAPTATISANLKLFSPEGDGRKDTVSITQRTSSEELWEATIKNSAGQIVKSLFWKGMAENFVWNGTDTNGSVVRDGTYRYDLTASDRAGNRISRSITGIMVDTRATSAYVSPAAKAISPNGDGVSDQVGLNLYASLNDGIESWSLTILDENGEVIRDLTTGSQTVLPGSIVWDGRSDGGSVTDGYYTPRLTMSYNKGNRVESEGVEPILVDVTGPTYNVLLVPKPFSPDGDGESDTLRVTFTSVQDSSTIVDWSLSIVDPYGNIFYERGGAGRPPTSFTWDGYSDDGELVQAAEDYQVETRMTDSMGNVGERTDTLPVDILVIREGDALKIRISSIQFAPNSPDFLEFDEEKAERNMKTLSRLAEILKKYSTYQIRIEGHAVSVYWNNAEKAKAEEEQELKPLSQARADAVKDALVDLGIPAIRMTTIGMGGTQPIVPHGDVENRWKSRRVEFILIK